MATGRDDLEADEEPIEFQDFETLPCNCSYVSVCVLMPILNGAVSGFIWSGYSLHFAANGWPLVTSGLSVTTGFLLRVGTQQLQLRAGYWLIVPFAVIHLAFAILALIYQTSLWAIFTEVVVLLCLDPTCAIEGIAFDTFGASEIQARMATSTLLSVFTIAVASSCTVGGILYDFGGWTAVATYHSVCQGLQLILLCLQPPIRKSFKEFFFANRSADVETAPVLAFEGDHGPKKVPLAVVPSAPMAEIHDMPGMIWEESLQSVSESEVDDIGNRTESGRIVRDSRASRGSAAALKISSVSDSEVDDIGNRTESGRIVRDSRASRGTANPKVSIVEHSQRSQDSRGRGGSPKHRERMLHHPSYLRSGTDESLGRHRDAWGHWTSKNSLRVPVGPVGTAGSRASRNSRASRASRASRESAGTGSSYGARNMRSGSPPSSRRSNQTGGTASSVFTALTSLLALSESGQDFRNHYLTSNALQPQIVGSTGAAQKLRLELDVDDDAEEAETGIPRDIRFPALLIVLCSLCNNCSYSVEFNNFAIYFKQVHNWNEATWAGLAQTAGDLMAAIAMKLIPVIFSSDYDPDKSGRFRRFLHHLTSEPYNLTFILFTWVLFNFGMTSPILPIAVVAQILMGTTYVYSSKWTTDMNLFYSMGDPRLFLNLQVLCRNADAVGGGIGGVLGAFLYTLDPLAPFVFTGALACVIFVVYTAGFCARLGFGEDIEMAEEKRSRRLGKQRVSAWANTKSQSQLPENHETIAETDADE
ncbi:unnamed protein product [Cladocopium goreaui]|uniref:Uncharacterized protein n=1 Tax=Cladocopium goreaui TaxID=2562237 RepID=A0A9P1BGF9_9DINO|nr:unnamed protein product [Cladocopium goreaui]